MDLGVEVEILQKIYGTTASSFKDDIERVLARHGSDQRQGQPWTERDIWLIAYPDHINTPGEVSLRTLRRFYKTRLAEFINGIHVLPFYPWSSDDGYAVTSYTDVDPRYGSWHEVSELASDCRLIVDAVINHTSSRHPWFLEYLKTEPSARGLYRIGDSNTDLSSVVRPRTTPLLTPFESRPAQGGCGRPSPRTKST